MVVRTLALATVIAAIAGTAMSETYRASNKMRVNVQADGTFEVSGTALLGPRSFWCAAGEFGANRLGLKQTDKVYVAVPLTSGRGPVRFTAQRPAGGETAWTVSYQSVRRAGSAVSVGLAQDYCRDHRLIYE